MPSNSSDHGCLIHLDIIFGRGAGGEAPRPSGDPLGGSGGDRLQVDYDIEVEALDVLVPSLVLQPLVENAVGHGIARVARPGRIEVRARRRHARVELAVIDDGAGCSEDVREGVGLGNTRARLAELYGGAARLEVEAGVERGFAVRLELPVEAPVLPPLVPPKGTPAGAEPAS